MRVVVCIPEAAAEAVVVQRLGRADAGTTVVRRCVDVVELVAAAGTAEAAVIHAGLRRLDTDVVLALHRAGMRVVLVGARGGDLGADASCEADGDAVLAALRSGRRRLPSPPEPLSPDTPHIPGTPDATGRLVAVWGPAGSPGRTTVALGLADELARLGRSTFLVDADTYGAALAVRLGLLEDVAGIAAACRAAGSGRLTPEGLARLSVRLESGLSVLTGLPRPDRWSEVRPAALDGVWAAARRLAALTLVDCGFGLEQSVDAAFEPSLPVRDAATIAAVGAADTVVCVGRLDPVGLVRLASGLPSLREHAPTAELIGVLVGSGRSPSDAVAARTMLAERCGLRDVVVVPADRVPVAEAEWAAATLAEVAPRSAARLALVELARRLGGLESRSHRRLRRVRSTGG